MKPPLKLYAIIRRAVEEGAAYGVRHGFKHRDQEPPPGLEAQVVRAVMDALDEVIKFEDG